MAGNLQSAAATSQRGPVQEGGGRILRTRGPTMPIVQTARNDQPSSSSPIAAIQLPATRTAMRAQGARSATTKAAASATTTNSVDTMPDEAQGARASPATSRPR